MQFLMDAEYVWYIFVVICICGLYLMKTKLHTTDSTAEIPTGFGSKRHCKRYDDCSQCSRLQSPRSWIEKARSWFNDVCEEPSAPFRLNALNGSSLYTYESDKDGLKYVVRRKLPSKTMYQFTSKIKTPENPTKDQLIKINKQLTAEYDEWIKQPLKVLLKMNKTENERNTIPNNENCNELKEKHWTDEKDYELGPKLKDERFKNCWYWKMKCLIIEWFESYFRPEQDEEQKKIEDGMKISEKDEMERKKFEEEKDDRRIIEEDKSAWRKIWGSKRLTHKCCQNITCSLKEEWPRGLETNYRIFPNIGFRNLRNRLKR